MSGLFLRPVSWSLEEELRVAEQCDTRCCSYWTGIQAAPGRKSWCSGRVAVTRPELGHRASTEPETQGNISRGRSISEFQIIKSTRVTSKQGRRAMSDVTRLDECATKSTLRVQCVRDQIVGHEKSAQDFESRHNKITKILSKRTWQPS